jgi:N-acetylglutamate synthase-like GNAT family acetyltransferase
MEKWRDELSYSPEYILKNKVYKLTIEDRIIAFYSYYFLDSRSVFMDNLFVDPDFIGKGFGKILMDDFLIKIMSDGKNRVLLHADPHVESFYLNRGFTKIGQESSTIPGRFMPIMELQL